MMRCTNCNKGVRIDGKCPNCGRRHYPVMDRPGLEELAAIGYRGKYPCPLPSLGKPCNGVVAVATGEFRCPLAGEWYLSGAIVEAYRAPNTLSTKFHIAELVAVPLRDEIRGGQ
jgi:hypothetical protein